ncbi:hypothetical protein CYMTET_28290 [Cymbomonas tetramitiformis]|uniref:EF-hand domain-containing protein n=1 Tax=Cymbomonas tetramitiformis TaxID=36881 RepID=A0AAE0KWB9_9CHLO|nr:hypothetical protein CYMTET_28290 [Cymbomonas tetramitiformis]
MSARESNSKVLASMHTARRERWEAFLDSAGYDDGGVPWEHFDKSKGYHFKSRGAIVSKEKSPLRSKVDASAAHGARRESSVHTGYHRSRSRSRSRSPLKDQSARKKSGKRGMKISNLGLPPEMTFYSNTLLDCLKDEGGLMKFRVDRGSWHDCNTSLDVIKHSKGIDQAKQIFEYLDSDGDGQLSLMELQVGFIELNLFHVGNVGEIHALAAELDKDGDGQVDIMEFAKFAKPEFRDEIIHAIGEFNSATAAAAAEEVAPEPEEVEEPDLSDLSVEEQRQALKQDARVSLEVETLRQMNLTDAVELLSKMEPVRAGAILEQLELTKTVAIVKKLAAIPRSVRSDLDAVMESTPSASRWPLRSCMKRKQAEQIMRLMNKENIPRVRERMESSEQKMLQAELLKMMESPFVKNAMTEVKAYEICNRGWHAGAGVVRAEVAQGSWDTPEQQQVLWNALRSELVVNTTSRDQVKFQVRLGHAPDTDKPESGFIIEDTLREAIEVLRDLSYDECKRSCQGAGVLYQWVMARCKWLRLELMRRAETAGRTLDIPDIGVAPGKEANVKQPPSALAEAMEKAKATPRGKATPREKVTPRASRTSQARILTDDASKKSPPAGEQPTEVRDPVDMPAPPPSEPADGEAAAAGNTTSADSPVAAKKAKKGKGTKPAVSAACMAASPCDTATDHFEAALDAPLALERRAHVKEGPGKGAWLREAGTRPGRRGAEGKKGKQKGKKVQRQSDVTTPQPQADTIKSQPADHAKAKETAGTGMNGSVDVRATPASSQPSSLKPVSIWRDQATRVQVHSGQRLEGILGCSL